MKFLDSKKSKGKKIYSVKEILAHKDMKGYFITDKNDKSKIFCETCSASFIPCLNTLKDHIKCEIHVKKERENRENIETYMQGQSIPRAELIWAYLTVHRNLSFNFSDYAKDYLPHIFRDSKIASNFKIYRQKVKKIIEEVLMGVIHHDTRKKMKSIFSIMIDGSRDVSNKNELIIAVQYYDIPANKIQRVVFDIIEQNNTTSQKLYETVCELLKENSLQFAHILALMTDNASDMSSNENGLAGKIKLQNKSIYTTTCICHKAALILTHLIKDIQKDIKSNDDNESSGDDEVFEEQSSVLDFVKCCPSFFNYSYKRYEEYTNFSTEYIEKMKKEITLFSYESYPKISKYCKVRFLSLGNSMSTIFAQWGCLFSYFHKKIGEKKINKRQLRLLEYFINSMNDP